MIRKTTSSIVFFKIVFFILLLGYIISIFFFSPENDEDKANIDYINNTINDIMGKEE